jgi:2-dehydropantoate 2-reductase
VDAQSTDSWRFERAAIVGAGAMGAGLAAMLGRIVPVVIVDHNAERAAQVFRDGVRTEGLVESAARPIVVRGLHDLPRVGGASAVFVATKTNAIPDVAAALRPLLPAIAHQQAGVFVVSFQNGIEPGRQLIEMLGDDRVLRMVLSLGAVLEPSGVVRVTLNRPPHAIGTLRPEYVPVCRRVAEVLTRGGLETAYDDRIELRVWEKGIVNAAMNPVAALVNSSVGEVLEAPAGAIVRALLQEAVRVARAEGVDLPVDYIDRAVRLYELARDHVPSMVDDIRRGRATEIGQLNRQVIDHARRLDIPVPTHEVIDALVETFDWKVYQSAPRPG